MRIARLGIFVCTVFLRPSALPTSLTTLAVTLRKSWEIANTELSLLDLVGEGATGKVYRARWRDMVVAVKIVGGGHWEDESVKMNLDKEATMLQAVRHPNIVAFLGAGVLADGSPFLVTEFMELGTLRWVLDTRVVGWDVKLRVAKEVARGMALVHSLGRMHRDLKADNILLTTDMHAKIADFGTAELANMALSTLDDDAVSLVEVCDADLRLRTSRGHGLHGPVGTPLWMAPEVLAERPHDARADVYSYGIVLWEIASQKLPWEDVRGPLLCDKLLERITTEVRPPVDSTWPRVVQDTMLTCWQTSPDERPTFATILRLLDAPC